MSLRAQVAGLLIVISISLIGATYAVQVWVVMPAFAHLEHQSAVRDVDRCVDAIGRDIEDLSNIANDWASWDDTYQYVQDRNETFAKTNLMEEAFSSTHINLLCILDANQQVIWGESRDMETLELIEVPDAFAVVREKSGYWTAHKDVDDAHSGILLTSQGPLLLASRPIITSKREGPIRGSVVMGRYLNEAEIKSLAERTHVSLNV